MTERLKRLGKASDSVQFAEWRLHDLRRTGATNLQALGISIEVTEAVLNHISRTRAGVAGIYNRYKYEPDKRTALNAWDARLREMLSTMRTSKKGSRFRFAGFVQDIVKTEVEGPNPFGISSLLYKSAL